MVLSSANKETYFLRVLGSISISSTHNYRSACAYVPVFMSSHSSDDHNNEQPLSTRPPKDPIKTGKKVLSSFINDGAIKTVSFSVGPRVSLLSPYSFNTNNMTP